MCINESYIAKLEDKVEDLNYENKTLRENNEILNKIILSMAEEFPKKSRKIQEKLNEIESNTDNSTSIINFYRNKLNTNIDKMPLKILLKTALTLYLDYDEDVWDEYKPDYHDYSLLRKGSIIKVYSYDEWNGEEDPNFKYVGLNNKNNLVMFFEDIEDIMDNRLFIILKNNLEIK